MVSTLVTKASNLEPAAVDSGCAQEVVAEEAAPGDPGAAWGHGGASAISKWGSVVLLTFKQRIS